MEQTYIYKLNNELDSKELVTKLIEKGYGIDRDKKNVSFFKFVEIDKNDLIYQLLLNSVSGDGFKEVLSCDKKLRKYLTELGFNIKKNKNRYEVIIDKAFEFNALNHSSYITTNKNDDTLMYSNVFADVEYLNSEFLNKYCPKEIKVLLDNNLIKKEVYKDTSGFEAMFDEYAEC